MSIETGEVFKAPVPTYELTEADADAITRRLIEERLGQVPEKYRFVGLEITPGDVEASNLGRRVERVVFEDKFSNDAEVMNREYGPYEAASRFFLSIDRQEQKVSGVLRVIENSPAGLKVLNDVQDDRWEFDVDVESAKQTHGFNDLDQVWDVGTVAVLPEYQGGKKVASIQLYRAMYVSAKRHRIEHLVAIIDVAPLADMRDGLGIPFESLDHSEPHPYIDSPASQAVHGYIPEFDAKASYHHRKTAFLRAIFKNNPVSRLLDGTQDDSIVLTQ